VFYKILIFIFRAPSKATRNHIGKLGRGDISHRLQSTNRHLHTVINIKVQFTQQR